MARKRKFGNKIEKKEYKKISSGEHDVSESEIRGGTSFRRVSDELSPFWDPNMDETHPNPLEGVYIGSRVIPARGKFKEQTLIEIETRDDGLFAVACKGNLYRKVKRAGLQEGQTVIVEWLGFIEPTAALPMGMHDYDLLVEDVE